MRQEGGKKVVRSRLPELGAVVFEVGDLAIKSLLHGRDWERVKEVNWAIHERHVVLHKQLLPLQISREQL
jgi:hypothetical protein